MNRVLLIAIIGFIITAAVVAAVSLRGQKKTTGTVSTKSAGELIMWRAHDTPENFKDAIQTYTQNRPDVKVTIVIKDPKDFETETLSALSAGKGPDIWSMPATWLPRHADKLIPAPEGFFNQNPDVKRSNAEVVTSSFAPIVGSEVIGSDQKVYGLPLSVDTLVVFANTALINSKFNELASKGDVANADLYTLGPRTWDEMITLAASLTVRDGATIKRPGISLGSANNVPHAAEILAALMLQNQTEMVAADHLSATFHLPSKKPTGEQFFPGTNALEFYTSFANPSSNRYTWNGSLGDARDLFLKGQLPLLIEYSHFANDVKARAPELAFRQLPLPQVRGAVQSIDFAQYDVETVTKTAANPTVAWDFLHFLASQGLPSYLISTGRPSPLKAEVEPQNILERVTFGNPSLFEQQSAKSWYRGKSPQKIGVAFTQMISDVTDAHLNAQSAIEKAAAAISQLLRTDAGVAPAPITQPQLVPQTQK